MIDAIVMMTVARAAAEMRKKVGGLSLVQERWSIFNNYESNGHV